MDCIGIMRTGTEAGALEVAAIIPLGGEKMKSHGVFTQVNQEVGEIIVADVNTKRIAELLEPNREALLRLITKQDY